ncbi:MAG: hypothetical protein KKC68_07015 [Candidatus Thermoplasmatota archaeon]|nr:hypothetical protein [Candidatus Thermoplasmatota archaeon]MBU1941510.1 hypothetical protein [Candidatus Thermoplasmatota archaeon]
MVHIKGMLRDKEDLRFVVYGGISGVMGLLLIVIMFFTVMDRVTELFMVILLGIVDIVLGVATVYLGVRAHHFRAGRIVIAVGIVIFVLVGVVFIIIPST